MQTEMDDFAPKLQMMKTILAFWKKYYTPEDSEQFWSDLAHDVNTLHEKYNDWVFDGFLMVCVDDIERRFKKSINSPFIAKEPLKEVYRRLTKER